MNTIELVAKMTELLEVINIENTKTAKAAHARARKAASELKTLAAEFKKNIFSRRQSLI
jgi:DNA-binding protein H-NS